MRRGFYCDQPEEDELPPELGDLDDLRGRQAADRALRTLRNSASARRVRVGVAVVGSISAIAVASPISTLLHGHAAADPSSPLPSPPTVPTAGQPPMPPGAEQGPPDSRPRAEQPAAPGGSVSPSPESIQQIQASIAAIEGSSTQLAQRVSSAEHAVSAALSGTGPAEVLSELDRIAATVSRTKTDADTVLRQAKDAAEQASNLGDATLASRTRNALNTAGELAERATATFSTHTHATGQARYASLVAATQRAVSEAEQPVASAEAAAAHAEQAIAAVRQAFGTNKASTDVAPFLDEAVNAVNSAAAPVAGGTAAGKAATDAVQRIHEQPQRSAAQSIAGRANAAANHIDHLRGEIPQLQLQLATLRHTEAVANIMTKATVARDAVAGIHNALEDAATVHASGVSQRDAKDFAGAERSAADANTKLALAIKAQTDADKALTAATAILTPDAVNTDPALRPAAEIAGTATQINTANRDRIAVLGQQISALADQAKSGRQVAEHDTAFHDQAARQPILQPGSHNETAVRQLKTMLNQVADARLDVNNGNFAATTFQRVKTFQAAHALPQTGTVDTATWYQLISTAGGLPSVPGPSAPNISTTPGAPNEKAASAVRAALTQLGVPYQWGASNPGHGFDCSGLTQWAYRQAGLQLPRTSTAQAVGARVTADQLQPGDLVVWKGHVAMYIGNGQMIEAGNPVQISKLRTTNIGMPFLGFYRPTA